MSLVPVVLLAMSYLSLSLAFSAEERTAEGRMELGGDFYFTYTSYNAISTTNIVFMPRICYFAVPRLAMEPKFLVVHQNISPPWKWRGLLYN